MSPRTARSPARSRCAALGPCSVAGRTLRSPCYVEAVVSCTLSATLTRLAAPIASRDQSAAEFSAAPAHQLTLPAQALVYAVDGVNGTHSHNARDAGLPILADALSKVLRRCVVAPVPHTDAAASARPTRSRRSTTSSSTTGSRARSTRTRPRSSRPRSRTSTSAASVSPRATTTRPDLIALCLSRCTVTAGSLQMSVHRITSRACGPARRPWR